VRGGNLYRGSDERAPTCIQPGITVTTSWGGGTWIFSQTYTGPGIYVETPGAPPGTVLDFIKFGPAIFAPGLAPRETVNMNGSSL
jgi:hypothetical protein